MPKRLINFESYTLMFSLEKFKEINFLEYCVNLTVDDMIIIIRLNLLSADLNRFSFIQS